jgi:hypothetical protein
MGQSRPVDALSAEHIDVVELGELLRREGFGRAERHVACIVNHDVKSARISNDLRNAGLDRLAGSNVELDGPEIDAVLEGIARNLRDLRRIAPGCLAHGGVNDVAGAGERAGSERTEVARGAADDNNLFHDLNPFMDERCLALWRTLTVPIQTIPPLARSVWPLIQAPSGPARKATVAAMSSG